ncbi:ABC transporter, extracellular substrate binding protein [Bifidobacterium sp. DSM 109958]|uniref:ABC transporter, extracellular substrate binding protein n=1 Tax=Bifidobacterium moraviense TaxID=2675323 RepID=A0A7Y0F2W0_9BIFI|nr:extracellular solute-binding protein [Bifidobacterium sp. DSM 109958]NMN01035.1 ABC transporter, extracellular substrate binding protein [Bifidobacterium sp. DSM 109958]
MKHRTIGTAAGKTLAKAVAIGAAGAMVFAVGACGSSNDAKDGGGNEITVAWWGNQSRNDKMTKVDDAFQNANSGVKVNGQASQWGDYWSKLQVSAAGKSMPDVIAMDYSYLQQYVDNGLLEPLDDYIANGTIKTDGIDKGVLASGQLGGKQYAISSGSSSPAMLVNQTVLDQAGITLPEHMTVDQFKDIARQVYEKTGYRTNFRYYDGVDLLEYTLRGKGKVLYGNNDGKLGVTAADVEDYFKVYEDGIKEGWHLDTGVFASLDASSVEQDPLVYGTDPGSRSWVSFKFATQLGAFQKAAAGNDNPTIKLYPWPAADVAKAGYVKPGQFWAISKMSKHKDLAAKYINWYTNDEEPVKIMGTDRGLPVNNNMLDKIKGDLSESDQAAVEFLTKEVTPNSSTINPPAPAGASKVNGKDVIGTIEESVLMGKISAADAATQFVDQANETLAKAK